MLLIGNDVAARVLDMHGTLAALEAVFQEEGQGAVANRTKANLHIPTPDGKWYRYCSMEGGSRALGVVAIRIKSDVLTWPVLYGKRRELKYCSQPGRFCGLIYLFSAVNGEPLAILNDGLIQHIRVGATYGIGAKYMARPDAQSLGLIGSGGMARTYAEAVALVRPLKLIRVYSPNRENCERYAAEMSERLGIPVRTAGSPAEAADGVDLLAAMTDSLDPVIGPEMLRPGMHISAVHSSHVEVSPTALDKVTRAANYSSGKGEHRFTTPECHRPESLGGTSDRTRVVEEQHIRCGIQKLTDIIAGITPGRRRDDEITYFTAEGTGAQFAATAKLVYDRAKEQELGRELPLDWFLQDIRN